MKSPITRMILFCLLFIIAGAANGVMDTISFHYYDSWFARQDWLDPQWWNPDVSWKNKYNSWFLRYWPGIAFSDAWHFFKAIQVNGLCLAPVLMLPEMDRKVKPWYYYVFAFAIIRAMYGIGFLIYH